MTTQSREALLAAHCTPLESDARMDDAAIAAQLQMLEGWTFADGSLRKTYRFEDYYRTLAFVNAMAWMIHREDHHPDLVVRYDSCAVAFNTHTAGGITPNDFICAAKADAIRAQGSV